MPFKCVSCNKVVQSVNEQYCKCDNPKFLKVPVIHFIHEEGEGILMSRTIRSETRPLGNYAGKNQTMTTQADLHLCCEAKYQGKLPPVAHITPDTVTCPQCLHFMDKLGIVDSVYEHDAEHTSVSDSEESPSMTTTSTDLEPSN